MKQIIKNTARSAALMVASTAMLLPLTTSFAFARDLSTDSSTTTVEDQVKPSETEVKNRVQTAEQDATKEVEQERSTKQGLSADKRKLVCENRQNAIDNKLAAFTQAADAKLTRLNDVYTKIQKIKTDNNLTVANYDTLIADANAKQQAATDAVAALKQVAGVKVDCTQSDPAVTLQSVKATAQAARQALHDYRLSLTAIVKALAQANDSSSTDATGSTTDAPKTTTGGNQ